MRFSSKSSVLFFKKQRFAAQNYLDMGVMG